MKDTVNKIGHPVFILSILTLILNDWYLKETYHNELTGKLSDFVGLFAFPFFFSSLFPQWKKTIHVSTGVIFIVWKSKFSQPLIDLLDSYGLPFSRVVDFSDNIALLSIIVSYYVFRSAFTLKLHPIFLKTLMIVSCLAFMATSRAPEIISFYTVPLKCGAAPGIGCGSRIKPLFIETEKESGIKESWSNREGTVIAIVWSESEDEKLIQSLFSKNDIEAKLILDPAEVDSVAIDFKAEDKWLKGMEVDQLSIEEAGVIANDLTRFAEEAKLITREESEMIRYDIEAYFKKELVIVRTCAELKSASTQNRWRSDGFAIYEKYIGRQRTDSVSAFYARHEEKFKKEESCCDKEKAGTCCEKKKGASLTSAITCPKCEHKKTEPLPTDVCRLKYTCEKCKTDLFPKDGDCCVFCSYGDHKCPSKQE